MRTAPEGRSGPGGTFVGRRAAMRELAAGLEEAEAGRGVLVLVTGEPGIGKTRLCMEFERHARACSARVTWGTCWEGEGAPAYWPWVQVLRDLIEPRTAEAPLPYEALPDDVAALISMHPPPAGPVGDPEQARFRLFDSLSRVLVRATAGGPLVVVLDDLHWADTPSLLALRFLAGELAGRGILILGTYRDVEVDADNPLAEALARLGGATRHISLPGLDHDEIGELIALITGADPDPVVVRSVLRRTGGNPFFVGELLRLVGAEGSLDSLVAGGSAARVPTGVRQVVDRRLRGLPAGVCRVLEAAAVLGQDFDVQVAASTAGLPSAVVASALEAAETARLVVRTADLARYEFSHALVREVLYDGIGSERRVDMHVRAAASLEQRYAADPAHVAEIAAHLASAAPEGDPTKAVAYSFDAGRRAMAFLAWEEATAHFARALKVLDSSPSSEGDVSRCELLVALGEARVRTGDTEGARQSFLAAADVAGRAADAPGLARAALGFATASPVWGVDPVLTDLLQRAIDVLGGREPALSAQLLARLAQAQYFSASDAEREEMSRRAVEMARASGEDLPMAVALAARRALWGPEDLLGRAAVANELLGLANRTHNADLEIQARAWRVIDRVEEGDVAAADRERLVHAALARRFRQPLHVRDDMIWRAMRALLDGAFADAEGFAEEALRLGEQVRDPGARSMFAVQRAMIRAELGEPAGLREAVTLVRAIADDRPEIPAWRALLAFCEARAGRPDEARLALEQVAAGGFVSVRRDATYLVALTHAADAAAILAHRDVAEALVPLLHEFADRTVVIDRGLACKGVTARLLGLLQGVLGRHDRAVELLERSLAAHERIGARAFAARNRAELAAVLLRRGAPGDGARSAALLAEARRAALTMHMTGLLGDFESLSTSRDTGDEAEHAANVFRREGEWWTVAFAGRVVRLRDAKGVRDIARLLAAPERDVHVLELVGAPKPAARAAGPGAEILDAPARRAYEARIVELDEEITEAESHHDTERAARAREESEFLVRELSAALGLGGRSRRVSDETERARKAVAWRIRDALARIERVHPALARHLRASLKTGVFCSYRPERAVTWRHADGPPGA